MPTAAARVWILAAVLGLAASDARSLVQLADGRTLSILEGAFADLFKRAVRAAVSGSWRAAGQSGAWSIRGFE